MVQNILLLFGKYDKLGVPIQLIQVKWAIKEWYLMN